MCEVNVVAPNSPQGWTYTILIIKQSPHSKDCLDFKCTLTLFILTLAPLVMVHSLFGSSSDIWRVGLSNKSTAVVTAEKKALKKQTINLVHTQKRRYDLENLQKTDMPPQADMLPTAKLEHATMHELELLGVFGRPSFRSVGIGILSENRAVTLYDPWIAADQCAARDELATDGGTRGWYDAFVHCTEGRMHAEGLVNARVEVWKCMSVCEPGWLYRPLVVAGSWGSACVELVLEFEITFRRSEQVVEERSQCDTPVSYLAVRMISI